MTELINKANKDTSIKAILVHGGKFFSSGNDLSKLIEAASENQDDMLKAADQGVNLAMVNWLLALDNCEKPLIAVVRGMAFGIAFTMLSLFDFVYLTPECIMKTPFMASCQSPEGSSTINFPQQMGRRLANEVLLLDKELTAAEAVNCGFANAIIKEDLGSGDWFDLSKVPSIGKLLETDYRTLVNSKQILNFAKEQDRVEKIIRYEGRKLVETWMEEEFPGKIANYMAQIMQKK